MSSDFFFSVHIEKCGFFITAVNNQLDFGFNISNTRDDIDRRARGSCSLPREFSFRHYDSVALLVINYFARLLLTKTLQTSNKKFIPSRDSSTFR